MKLKCKNCKHEWEYRGKSKYYATCPRCHYLVKVELKEASPTKRKTESVKGTER